MINDIGDWAGIIGGLCGIYGAVEARFFATRRQKFHNRINGLTACVRNISNGLSTLAQQYNRDNPDIAIYDKIMLDITTFSCDLTTFKKIYNVNCNYLHILINGINTMSTNVISA